MEKVSVFLLGDSICHTNNFETYPQVGWGQVFGCYLRTDVVNIVNMAQNGRSTKSFIDEGWFVPVERAIKKNDYLFINFGHNDEKKDEKRHTEPYSTYQENLKYFIDTAKKVGAIPVLVSSIYRRHFDENGKLEENCHGEYPKAMEELARREGVIYIDLCAETRRLLQAIGPEASKEMYMNFGPGIYKQVPEGKEDNSHLREKGANIVCQLLVREMLNFPILKILIRGINED